MNRVAYWPSVLAAFIEERRHTPFKWGSNDCALFVADTVERITGVDPAEDLRGYRSKNGSQKALEEQGAEVVTDYVTQRFGESIHVSRCRRGDIVEHLTDDGVSVGICLGSVFCAPGDKGLVFFSMADAVRGWRVWENQ